MPSPFKTLKRKKEFRYSPIGSGQIRLLRYAQDSTPDSISLQIQSFGRKDAPRYIALSYVWGEETPLFRIRLNNQNKDVQPNLHNALRCMRNAFPQWFWIDALCIDQENANERNEQVRQMEHIYAKAHHVAAWLGLCSEQLRPLFDIDPETTNMRALSPEHRKRIELALKTLSDMQYWRRIWIQQEILLNRTIILHASGYSQPLHPLIDWESNQGRTLTLNSTLFADISSAVDWAKWRRSPVLRLLTWARKHQSRDRRDKMFALLSLTAEHERAALGHYFPDYRLDLAQVVMVALAHVRRFAGQKRAVQQLDEVLECFGERAESGCAKVVSKYFWDVDGMVGVVDGRKVIRVSAQERSALGRQRILDGDDGSLSVLDVCDYIFSEDLGPGSDQQVDVRSSKAWRRSQTWVLDPPLSGELRRFWFMSVSQDMEDLRM